MMKAKRARRIPAAVLFLFLTFSCTIDPGNTSSDDDPYVMVQRDISVLTNVWANSICYSGYRNGQSPEADPVVNPTYDQVKEDLLILEKNWKVIRMYAADAQAETALQVIRNEGINLKVFLGLWICQYDSVNISQVAEGIRLANEYSNLVPAVIVGNEAMFSGSDHAVTPSKMIGYVRSVRKAIRQPVTVADVFDFWVLSGAPVAAEIDFIMIHIYPLWYGNTIGNATSYSTNTYNGVKNTFPTKYVCIGEAGWASRSDNTYMITNQANEENQDRYYREMTQWASNNNTLVFHFQAFDEDWKHSFSYYDPNDPEKHWGLFMTNRKAKLAMYGIFPELIDPSHVPSSN